MADELVDVVGPDGAVLGTVTRTEMRAGRLRHRCTFVLVRNTAGQVLVHRRSELKDMWPGRWDLACGGVVTAGEDWEPAARRELAEEVGVTGVDLHPLGVGEYSDDDVDEVARVYGVSWDGPVHFADGEVVEARWVDVDELRRLIDTRPFVPDSLRLVLPHVLGAG